jgi:chitinase
MRTTRTTKRLLAVALVTALSAHCGGSTRPRDAARPDSTATARDGRSPDGGVETATPVDAAPAEAEEGAAVVREDAADAEVAAIGEAPDGGADGAPSPEAHPKSVAHGPKWVTGYYASYQAEELAPEDVPWTALTHIVVTAALPQVDGTLNVEFSLDATDGPALADDLVTRAHAAGVRALLMLGGKDTHDAFVAAATDELRPEFVADLVRWARDEHHFDGLDLDWEPLLKSDHAAFRSLAQELRKAWPDAILTVPIAHLNVNLEPVDPFYAEIAPLFDQLNVMTYGMTGTFGGWQSWHGSALYGESRQTPTSIASSVQRYVESGIPAAKLGLGVAFYGVCYTPPVDGPKQELRGATVAAADERTSYRAIMTRYFAAEARRWDDEAKSPYLSFAQATGPAGCGFLSYEDEQSLAERTAYVDAQGLGGVIVWTINEGHLPTAPAGERDPLLDALREGLLHP